MKKGKKFEGIGSMNYTNTVEKWAVFELEAAVSEKFENPFTAVRLEGLFIIGGTRKTAGGFYDGDGVWRIRFMPEETGEYIFVTKSNIPALDGLQGCFACLEASDGNHGPVRVSNRTHFSHADSTPFFIFGTTAYCWAYQPEETRAKTLESFSKYGFSKIRMMFFPKCIHGFDDVDISYDPPCFPFEGEKGRFDFKRFHVEYFRNFEERVKDLLALGIEADVILFHFYDFGQWNIDTGMQLDDQRFYLKYLMARLAAYRNVWWSLANEYDMSVEVETGKFRSDPKTKYWDTLGCFVMENDPYGHLRSIHNMAKIYPNRDWMTHVSYQSPNTYNLLLDLKKSYGKPVVADEYEYEGNLKAGWGNSKPEKEVFSHWLSAMAGGYATHGEAYIVNGNNKDIFWAYGGTLVGDSPERLKYLKEIVSQCPFQEMEPDFTRGDGINLFCLRKGEDDYLYFIRYGGELKWFPQLYPRNEKAYDVTVYDVWNCMVTYRFYIKAEENQFLSPGISYEPADWSVVRFVRNLPE